jgi:hypothetical protein
MHRYADGFKFFIIRFHFKTVPDLVPETVPEPNLVPDPYPDTDTNPD